jgi:3-oxoacyl-[acyl-carrier protein] reductase
MDFKGKTILVTGSSRGIGAATIRKFASLGANVVINYVSNEDKALELKKEVEDKYGVKALAIKCDVSKEEEVIEMFNEIDRVFHRINVVVNNAGIAIDTTFEDKTVENFKKTIDTNLIGTFLVSKHAVIHLKKEKNSRIINVASTNGIDTYYPESLDYDASKAGVISLTHNFAKALAPDINVNAVAPGWVKTEMNKELDENDYVNGILMKRFADPMEVANVIAFLASDEASYINNEVIRVDGGELE